MDLWFYARLFASLIIYQIFIAIHDKMMHSFNFQYERKKTPQFVRNSVRHIVLWL